MINIKKLLNQSGGNPYKIVLKSLFEKPEYNLSFNENDFIDENTGTPFLFPKKEPQKVWIFIKNYLDLQFKNKEITNNKKEELLTLILDSLIGIVLSLEESDDIEIAFKIKNNDGTLMDAKYVLLERQLDAIKKQPELDVISENIDDVTTKLGNTLSKLVNVKDKDTKYNNLNKQISELDDILSTFQLSIDNSPQIQNIDVLKQLEENLSLLKLNLNKQLINVNYKVQTNENMHKENQEEQTKNISVLAERVNSLANLIKQAGGNRPNNKLYLNEISNIIDSLIGGFNLETLDPNNILEAPNNEKIPKGKYSDKEFVLFCKGHKWDICDDQSNIKKSHIKWIKGKLSTAWVKHLEQYKTLSTPEKEMLKNIRVLFKIERQDKNYTFTKGQKAYLIVKRLNNEDNIVTKLLDYDTNHYEIFNSLEMRYHKISLNNENVQTLALKEIFPEIYNNTNLTNKQKKEKKKEIDAKNSKIRQLYFNVFKADIIQRKPIENEHNEESIPLEDKLYDTAKLEFKLPESNLKAKEGESGNIYYQDDLTGKVYDENFGHSHFWIYEKIRKFKLFDKEFIISSNAETPKESGENIEHIIIPHNFILYYDYDNNGFVLYNPITKFRYWGVPLLKYSTNNYYITYSPSFETLYVLDLQKYSVIRSNPSNNDDNDTSFLINSFSPDKKLLDMQVNILKLKEIEANPDILNQINELSKELELLKDDFNIVLKKITKNFGNRLDLIKDLQDTEQSIKDLQRQTYSYKIQYSNPTPISTTN